jgi:hypothetical protein
MTKLEWSVLPLGLRVSLLFLNWSFELRHFFIPRAGQSLDQLVKRGAQG